VLAPVLDETASRIVESHFEENGTRIITKHTIKKVLGKNRFKGVVLDNDTKLPCEMLIIAIGVRPRVEIVRDTKVKVNRGIVVDRRMRTSLEGVYACGDCAEVYDFIYGDFRLTPLWSTAYVGGRIAGFNMCGVAKEYGWGTNMNSMHFFGLPVITAGISANDEGKGYEILKVLKEEEGKEEEREKKTYTYKKIVLKNNHVIGMILLNRIDRAGIFLGVMRDEIDVSSFKEELLSDDFGLINLPEEVREAMWMLK
jgi:NAD(P)H-nitrite reductase large subunit